MILQREEHRFYMKENGKLMAEIRFPFVEDGIVDIDHTFVDAALQGQGMAGYLVQQAVEEIRRQGWKCIASCSYANAWMKKHGDDHSAYKSNVGS